MNEASRLDATEKQTIYFLCQVEYVCALESESYIVERASKSLNTQEQKNQGAYFD